MSGPVRIARSLALCSLILFFSPSCSLFPSSSPPIEAPEESIEPANQRVEQISRDVILIVRRLNINNLAFLRNALPPSRYRVALGFLIPEIQALAQQVVDVIEGSSGQSSVDLLEAIDPLSRAAREFRRYVDTNQDDALAAAYAQLAYAHVQLEDFLANTTLEQGPTLLNLYLQAGRIEIVAESTAVFRVVLGPFANIEEAQDAQAAATSFDAVISEGELPTVWLGPFRAAAEAQAVAAQWREINIQAAIREDTVYEFRATEVSPVQGRTWRELVWVHVVEQPAHFIAVSPDGNVVLVGDTSGTIQRRTGQGDHQWTQTLALPTYALAVTREGEGIFTAGIGAQSLDGDGGVRWRDSLDTYNVILESAAISNNGQFMVASTSNAEGLGQAFGFSETGLAWVTPVSLGVNTYYLSSDGTKIALGAVGEGRFHVIVLNERGEQVMGSDLAEPVVRVAIAGLNEKLVVLTQRHVSQFDIESQQIEWQAAARGRTLTVSQPGDIIYVGGVQGITAFFQDGRQLWTQDAVPVSQIVANRDYLIGLSDNIRLVVIRFDGTILGTVSPLAPIRDFAVATDGNLLVVLDEENRLSAWHLPPPTE